MDWEHWWMQTGLGNQDKQNSPVIQLASALLRIMGNCGRCRSKPDDDHESVPIEPRASGVARNLHEFPPWHLTGGTR